MAALYLERVLISLRVKSLPLPRWKEVQCQRVGAWEPRRMVPYRELSVGLFCWQDGYLAEAVPRSASGNGSPYCGAQAQTSSLPPRPLGSRLHQAGTRRNGLLLQAQRAQEDLMAQGFQCSDPVVPSQVPGSHSFPITAVTWTQQPRCIWDPDLLWGFATS